MFILDLDLLLAPTRKHEHSGPREHLEKGSSSEREP